MFQMTMLPPSSRCYFLPCWPFHSEDGGSMVLWNVGILPHHYMVS